MKIGAMMVANCDKENIAYSLQGIYDFCDKIVVVYSDTTWANEKKEDGTAEIIDSFPDPENKLKIIKGSFPSQYNQRTVGLEYLRKINYDYIFVVDSDEIYHPKSLIRARAFVEKHKDNQGFVVKWCPMWKTLDTVVIPYMQVHVIYELKGSWGFAGHGRRTTSPALPKHKQLFLPGVICYHLTCVCSDEYMKEKLRTRGYKNQVRKGWYENIWLKWNYDLKNTHPTRPDRYREFKRFDKSELPDFMKTHKYYGAK